MVLDATKIAMKKCIEGIEANNAKYPIPPSTMAPLYRGWYLWHDQNHEQWYRNMKEQQDVWDY